MYFLKCLECNSTPSPHLLYVDLYEYANYFPSPLIRSRSDRLHFRSVKGAVCRFRWHLAVEVCELQPTAQLNAPPPPIME